MIIFLFNWVIFRFQPLISRVHVSKQTCSEHNSVLVKTKLEEMPPTSTTQTVAPSDISFRKRRSLTRKVVNLPAAPLVIPR